jgi:hypothetical protein
MTMNIDSMTIGEPFDLVAKWFADQGYAVLEKPEINANGPDMHVVGNSRTLRVEIKACRVLDNGTWQTHPLTETQKSSDCVAVVLPTKAVIVASMCDYISRCSEGGYRNYTWLRL